MTDRELLELAAKAHGLVGEYEGYQWLNGSRWNPLADDGDALRLAVKLRLQVDLDYDDGKLRVFGPHAYALEPHGTDIYAATRRAIVRAAAEIGGQS